MSYEVIKAFEHRGFKCEISQVFPEDSSENPFYDYCVIGFAKPTSLDRILFFAIDEGDKSTAVAALLDFLGMTGFYPGDFNKDVDTIMHIGNLRHDEHIWCYSGEDEENEQWKRIMPSEGENILKSDIDKYHDIRKRMIQAMKLYRSLVEKMHTLMNDVASGKVKVPS